MGNPFDDKEDWSQAFGQTVSDLLQWVVHAACEATELMGQRIVLADVVSSFGNIGSK
jgi:hypothetical protein